ncbi:MAG TPA: bacteriohopanetetrol glucosamine biosynthesis glycosyltransferase HpnI [Steroidobacteraceae bacterium]|nr:bacteriohopanetetrol glucosamine biosynthesis glycosyltransferase HpnI [Steroidobacteraceae bacterium]
MGAAAQLLAVACGIALAAIPAAYLCIAVFAVRRRPRGGAPGPAQWPAVTVLKPLCGAEFATYECLRSFCRQDFPCFEIVFGVQDPADAAVEIVQRLIREYPRCPIRVVVDRRQHGSNRKVGNLINMMAAARHDHLVIADSDILVAPDYLRRIVAPLLDPAVGIVTCAYRGLAEAGLPSLLGSLFVNDWFLPSVRIAALFGSRRFAFGATIALRRDALAAIGGFAAVADRLADDYALGELTRRLGLRTVLSAVEVETVIEERRLRDLLRHELRWLRTIRAVRPLGYALSVVTFGVPVAALGALLSGIAPAALACTGIAAGARLVLHWRVRGRGAPPWDWLALPLGDLLSFALWCWGFAARRVQWRDDRYLVTGDGSVQQYEDSTR